MNYRVDGRIDGTKNTRKCFLQPSAAKKEWLPLPLHVSLLSPTKKRKTRLQYLQELSWKISKEALPMDTVYTTCTH